jgi:hypothetical protein
MRIESTRGRERSPIHGTGYYVPGDFHKPHWFPFRLGFSVRRLRFVVKHHKRHRLHINALLLDPFYGVQGKFLKIFAVANDQLRNFSRAGGHECTPITEKNAATNDAAGFAEYNEVIRGLLPAIRVNSCPIVVDLMEVVHLHEPNPGGVVYSAHDGGVVTRW